MKISLYQFCIDPSSPVKNLERITRAARNASQQGSDTLVLPELCLHSYAYQRFPDYHPYFLPKVEPVLGRIATDAHIGIAGTFVECRSGNYYNTFCLFDPTGQVALRYQKIHLFKQLREDRFFSAGSTPSTANTSSVILGALICYDLRFPEIARILADSGAQLLVIPAEWPLERIRHWQVLLQARAIENQVFIAGVNTCGLIQGIQYGGCSMLVDPQGNIRDQLDQEEGSLTVEIDMNEVLTARQRFPVHADRRNDLY